VGGQQGFLPAHTPPPVSKHSNSAPQSAQVPGQMHPKAVHRDCPDPSNSGSQKRLPNWSIGAHSLGLAQLRQTC
jgi:hypothetical protein